MPSGKLSKSEDVSNLDEFFISWGSRSGSQHIALLGDYGQGKSTAALELTYRALHDGEFAAALGRRIPLFIRLTGLSPMTTTPEDLLGAWGTKYGLNGRALLALHRAGRTILIFDAFDEMANVSDRGDRFNHFWTLWQHACPGSRIMFTGRPNFFLDDEELKGALGISEGKATGPYCSAIRIEPFSLAQIQESLRWLSDDQVSLLVNTIDKLPHLKEIAERPSLLFQLSQLWHSGRLNLESTNIESASIIQEFVTYCIERQVAKQSGNIASDSQDHIFIPLRQSELEYFTAGCAVASLDEGRNNSLPEPVFHQTISELWNKIGDNDFPLNFNEGQSLLMSLRERLRDRPEPVETCKQAVRTHGVLEHDPSRSGVYKFSHKSFAEVMAASVITAGALSRSDESWKRVWLISRPIHLIKQFAIFNFCRDLAISYLHDEGKTNEFEVYSNISSFKDNVLAKFAYTYWRLITRISLRTTKNEKYPPHPERNYQYPICTVPAEKPSVFSIRNFSWNIRIVPPTCNIFSSFRSFSFYCGIIRGS